MSIEERIKEEGITVGGVVPDDPVLSELGCNNFAQNTPAEDVAKGDGHQPQAWTPKCAMFLGPFAARTAYTKIDDIDGSECCTCQHSKALRELIRSVVSEELGRAIVGRWIEQDRQSK